MSTAWSDFSSAQNKQLLQRINKNQIQIADNLTARLDVDTPSQNSLNFLLKIFQASQTSCDKFVVLSVSLSGF